MRLVKREKGRRRIAIRSITATLSICEFSGDAVTVEKSYSSELEMIAEADRLMEDAFNAWEKNKCPIDLKPTVRRKSRKRKKTA